MSRQAEGSIRLLHFPGWVDNLLLVDDLPAELTTHRDAIALPLRSPERGPRILGAIYDEAGRLIEATQRAKTNRAWAGNPPERAIDGLEPETVPGRTYFGGHLRLAFGHVLLEVLPRFWPAPNDRACDQVVFYPTRIAETTGRPLPAYAADLMRAVGVDPDRRRLVAGRPLRFEELTVASPAFWLKCGVSPRAAAAFQQAGDRLAADARTTGPIASPPPDTNPGKATRQTGDARRLYLSRSRLTGGARRATNELAIEALVAAAGFDIVHPQELPVATQVRLIREASVIAGCDGSALHLAVFARPGTKLVAFDSRLVPNQLILDGVAGIDAVHALVAIGGAAAGRADAWTADISLVREALAAVL